MSSISSIALCPLSSHQAKPGSRSIVLPVVRALQRSKELMISPRRLVAPAVPLMDALRIRRPLHLGP